MEPAQPPILERFAAHPLIEQATQHAFILVDVHARIRQWSPGAKQLFGHSPEQAVGMGFAELFTADDRQRGIPQLEMAIARSAGTSEDDRWHVRADGSLFWGTGTLTALRGESGQLVGFGKIVRDRTNLKEQLEAGAHKLESSRAETANRDVAIAKLSHELKNLLTALTHGLEMLWSPKVDSARKDSLPALMRTQISLVGRLAEDLLDAQRLKTGKMSLQLCRTVLQTVVTKAVDSLRPRLPSKELQLDLLMPPTPVVVLADEVRLLQTFTNLIDNAIKYTPEGGRIWVKMTVEDPEAVLHVQDTGLGIPPDMLSKIFDLFTQVQTPAAHAGLGIGLALVRDIVSMHDGSIQARSEGIGKGSEFTVRLPLEDRATDDLFNSRRSADHLERDADPNDIE